MKRRSAEARFGQFYTVRPHLGAPVSLDIGCNRCRHKACSFEGAFGADIDHAMLAKIYVASLDSSKGRYSPSECTGAVKMPIEGSADANHISTSFVERQNLTMRISIRRFTTLTNAFSKKIEKRALSVASHYMLYNFARIHKRLRISPAVAAGITDKLWSVADIVEN